jgi:pimeloyl-ACP methyl ester carboxylesterase
MIGSTAGLARSWPPLIAPVGDGPKTDGARAIHPTLLTSVRSVHDDWQHQADAYRRDVPHAEVHVIDAGHFALDEAPELVTELTGRFLDEITGDPPT